MDDTIKQALLSRFSAYLDTAEDEPAPPDDPGETADLYSVFVEVAGLRSEVRTESRLVKEALDQFRGVFDLLRTSQATVQQELDRAGPKRATGTRGIASAVAGCHRPAGPSGRRPEACRDCRAPAGPIGCCAGTQTGGEAWQDGLRMIVRRLDQVLLDRGVVADASGRPAVRPAAGARCRYLAGQVRGGGNSHRRGPDRLSLGRPGVADGRGHRQQGRQPATGERA